MLIKYRGVPYHLWNSFTDMEQCLRYLGFGPSVISRGEGPYVYNDRGQRYINGLSSLWYVVVGHGREELVPAAAQWMRELAYASCFRQVHPRAIELAAKLVEITGGRFRHVYLDTNGSDTLDHALDARLRARMGAAGRITKKFVASKLARGDGRTGKTEEG